MEIRTSANRRSAPAWRMDRGETPGGSAAMISVQILGIGSPCGDDQAGWLVVDALANRLPEGVQTTRLDRPGSALIAQLEIADHVILVDAMQGGGKRGEIRCFNNDEWASYRNGLSSHGMGVFDALMLARELGCLPGRFELYGIEIGSTLPGQAPCKAIISAARQLADKIAADWHEPDHADSKSSRPSRKTN